MSSGLPSMAVEPVEELSNKEWSLKELNSFLLNEGAYLSGKEGVIGAVSFPQSVDISDYCRLKFVFIFSTFSPLSM